MLIKKKLSFYKNKKVFVTGATGFKGSWLCLWLVLLGAKVYGTAMKKNSQKLFYQLQLQKKVNLSYLDIRKDYSKIEKKLKKIQPQIIFHLAAQPLVRTSYEEPLNTFSTNIMGTANILDIAFKVKSIRSLVCITSDKVYKNLNWVWGYKETDILGGDDPYSASKASAEIIIKSYRESFGKKRKNLGIASARAGNVIGGGDMSKDRLIPDTIKNLLKNKTVIIRNPNANRPWQHVLEPLYGYLILAKNLYLNRKKYSEAFNFGPSTSSILNVKEIVKNIIKIWGYGKVKIIKKNNYPKEQQLLQLNSEKTMSKMHWKPFFTTFETISETTHWYKKVFKDNEKPLKITTEQIEKYQNNKY